MKKVIEKNSQPKSLEKHLPKKKLKSGKILEYLIKDCGDRTRGTCKNGNEFKCLEGAGYKNSWKVFNKQSNKIKCAGRKIFYSK